MGRGLERRHLTQSGDRDEDRPRVFADYGYLSGDSTPLLVAKDRRTSMTFAAALSMKGGMDWWVGMPGSHCQNRRVRELCAEGKTTVDEIGPPMGLLGGPS